MTSRRTPSAAFADWQAYLPSEKDQLGQRVYLTSLVAKGVIDAEVAAQYLGVQKRKVREYVKRYQANSDSHALVDRRRFSQGQKKTYRMEEHSGPAVKVWTMNLLRDEPTSGRTLEQQLQRVVSARTIDRFLQKSGLREAEELGLRQNVKLFLQQEREKAYWAGVAGEPLNNCVDYVDPSEWQEPRAGQTGIALGLAHLVRIGAYSSLGTLVDERSGRLSASELTHSLILYLLASGGSRLSP